MSSLTSNLRSLARHSVEHRRRPIARAMALLWEKHDRPLIRCEIMPCFMLGKEYNNVWGTSWLNLRNAALSFSTVLHNDSYSDYFYLWLASFVVFPYVVILLAEPKTVRENSCAGTNDKYCQRVLNSYVW